MLTTDYLEKRMEVLAPYNTQQNNPHHIGDLMQHIKKMVDSINLVAYNVINETAFSEAIIFHDIGKKETKQTKNEKDVFYGHPKAGTEIIKNSRKELGLDQLSDENYDYLLELVLLHDTKYTKMGKINNMVDSHPEGFSSDLLNLQILDILGQSDLNRSEKLEEVKDFTIKIAKADNITANEIENFARIITCINYLIDYKC